MSIDGEWAHCSREEFAGAAPFNDKTKAYIHKLEGDCKCGASHGDPGNNVLHIKPRTKKQTGNQAITAKYDYLDEAGELLYQVVRYEDPKTFKQRRKNSGGGWVWSVAGISRVLYRLPEILEADTSQTVYVCEGEKDVERLGAEGLLATTNAQGAGKWQDEFSDTLEGRPVVILPDNDEAGRKHARMVAASLSGKARSVKVLDLPGLQEGGDSSNYLEAGGTGEGLEQLAKDVPEWEPDDDHHDDNPLLAGLVNLAAMIEDGVEDPEELEPGILLKGKVHHIFAPAAVGKTYLAIWFAARQIKRGRRVLYLDAENGARIFAERLKAMGCQIEDISKHLFYIPFPNLDMSAAGIANYSALIEHTNPALVIFDSWIKFLSSAGLAENENDDIARWAASFLQPIRNAGITSVVLDHVPHEGTRSRGASRKKDEVDVQYALVKTQKFDRATVGEIRLKLEKDREGWLPEFTTFSIGGGKDGFVFERSSGTVAGPGQIILKSREKEAFEILAGEFGEAGARHNEWLKACERKGISRTTFRRARDELIRGQVVRREEDTSGPLYFPALVPTGARGGGPDFSPYITVIPDRGQQGPHRGHEPDGPQEGPQGPPSLRSGPVAPAHDPGASDELIERVEQALEFGNVPKKALENYRNGDQDIDSVVEAVKNYYGRGRGDVERWRAPVIAVVEERATSSAPSAPGDDSDDSAGGLGGRLREIRDRKRAAKEAGHE
jgi:hypothetical protein